MEIGFNLVDLDDVFDPFLDIEMVVFCHECIFGELLKLEKIHSVELHEVGRNFDSFQGLLLALIAFVHQLAYQNLGCLMVVTKFLDDVFIG